MEHRTKRAYRSAEEINAHENARKETGTLLDENCEVGVVAVDSVEVREGAGSPLPERKPTNKRVAAAEKRLLTMCVCGGWKERGKTDEPEKKKRRKRKNRTKQDHTQRYRGREKAVQVIGIRPSASRRRFHHGLRLHSAHRAPHRRTHQGGGSGKPQHRKEGRRRRVHRTSQDGVAFHTNPKFVQEA